MTKLFYSFCFVLSSCFSSELENLVGNAGCLIKNDNKILLVTQNNEKLSIPGGRANENETAIQTAIRETYEETQQVVTISKLIKKFSNGFYLFECKIQKKQNTLSPLELYKDEIKKVGFYDMHHLKPNALRFPSQYNLYLHFQNRN